MLFMHTFLAAQQNCTWCYIILMITMLQASFNYTSTTIN